MMLRRTTDQAFALFQRTSDPRALARVFDNTAAELLQLARHLASCEALAEDLVQATFVTAIEASQTQRTGDPVLPWLIGILGNHARAARRKSRRALDASRATHDDTVDPVRDAERHELQGQVADTIASLPEIYRPVLRLYLEQGLEPAEIARALERPQGTVRAQVHRGLELLRAALPAALGAGAAFAAGPARGLAAMREAVVARCGEQVGSLGVTALSLGTLIMMKLKVTAGVVAFVVATFYLWQGFVRTDTGASLGEAIHTPASMQTNATATPKASVAEGASEGARTEIVSAPPADSSTKTTLRVIVHGGSPQAPWKAAGVTVRLQALAALHDLQGGDPVVTDREGVAEFVDIATGDTVVRVDHAEVRQFVAVEGGKDQEVRVRIPQGITVTGSVRDAAGPVANARVLAHALVMEPDLVATTDAHGEFTVRHLAANVSLQARAAGYAPSLGLRVQGQAGSTVRIDLVLGAKGRRVTGQVRDPDGHGVANARVAITGAALAAPGQPFPFALFTRTDRDGRFVVDEVGPDAVIVVGMPPRAGSAAPGIAIVGASDMDATADVQLRRGATLHGVVRGRRSARGDLSVQAWAEKPVDVMGYLANVLGIRHATVGEDGTYRLTGLIPGRHQLRVMGHQIVGSHTIEIAEGGEYEWNPSRAEGPGLSLQITPATPPKGLLTPIWMARLYRRTSDGNLEFLNFAMTDRQGAVKFGATDEGNVYDVVVAVSVGRGAFNDVIVAHRRDVRAQREPHSLVLDEAQLPSARVRGRLVDGNGTPRSNATILARAHVSEILVSHASTLTDRDGRFDLGPLPPGAWNLLFGTEPTAPTFGQHQLAANQSLDLGDVIH